MFTADMAVASFDPELTEAIKSESVAKKNTSS